MMMMMISRGGRQRGVVSNSPKSGPEARQTQAASTNTTSKVDTGSSGNTQQTASSSTTKMSWLRGYLGAHSNTDPPDAKFLGVAAIVLGAGFYAWFLEPPVRKEDS